MRARQRPHNARSYELALCAVGVAGKLPRGGAPPAFMRGVCG